MTHQETWEWTIWAIGIIFGGGGLIGIVGIMWQFWRIFHGPG